MGCIASAESIVRTLIVCCRLRVVNNVYPDGLVDCEDPECCESPVCERSQLCHTVSAPIGTAQYSAVRSILSSAAQYCALVCSAVLCSG